MWQTTYHPPTHAHRACILSARAHSNIAISAARTTITPRSSCPPLFLFFPSLPHPFENTLQPLVPVKHLSKWLLVPRTLASRPLRSTSPARYALPSCPSPQCRVLQSVLLPDTAANCSPIFVLGLALTFSRAKIVCRAVRARAVRRRQCRKVHNWSRPDQDGLLRRP